METNWSENRTLSQTIFFELRAPLRIPTGVSRSNGARGVIVDQETGEGIPGALVRLGTEAAISDAKGRVTFASLQPGRYTARVESGASGGRTANKLLVGDVSIEVPQDARHPVDFSLALVKGGSLRIDLRQMAFATIMATSSPDSLVDAGAIADATIALIGQRDSVYAVTDADGIADFRDVPVGPWTVRVIPDNLPTSHVLDAEERPVAVLVGQRTDISFRALPKRQAVQFIQSQGTVVAPPTPAPPTPARPIPPME